jgi:hypothetical protein
VRWDRDSLGDAYERIEDLGTRAELAIIVILVVGAAITGALTLVGLDIGLSAGGGFGIAVVGMGLLWLRARRRGTSLLGED